MNQRSDVLTLEAVGKSFGSTTVLRDITLSVASNEFLTILGPSGSGKTTILRLIAGFEAPTTGRIMLDGADISQMPINRRPFNTVFQDYALFPHLSVRRNVGYGLMVRGVPKAEIEPRVEAVLAIVGLQDYALRLPRELSGGQRHRVALARAIICEPRVILLDEPLAALDVALRAQMCKFLKDIQRRLDIAFVFITHDQQEAIAMSDRIVVMRDGRIEQIGGPEELYAFPASRFVAGFFGENNLIDGVVGAVDGARCKVETPIGPLWGSARGPAAVAGAEVHLAIRPEALVLGATDGHRFVVRDAQFAGPTTLIEAQGVVAAEVTLRLRVPSGGTRALPAVGDVVAIGWSETDARVIAAEGSNG